MTAATPAPEHGSPGTPDGRASSGPADAATPGQAAYEAWFDAAHGFMPAVTTAAEVWARGTSDWHSTWEAAAKAGHAASAAQQPHAADGYPRQDGDFIVIGPDCFAMPDGSVLSWRGQNYMPRPDPAEHVEPAPRQTADGRWGILLADEIGKPQPVPEPPFPGDGEVTTPAVTRPPFGSTLILAVPSGTDEADVQRLRDHLAASAPDEHVTVTVVRDVEALRTWEPQPAAGLAAAMAETASRELAAAMAEARGYRNALQQVAKHIDSEHAQLRIVARIAKRAMEGL